MREELKSVLLKQGYGVVGEHVGVKLCHWTKEDLKKGRHCYKGDFYGIESRGCMQMTPIVDYCNFTCLYCWRSQSFDLDINTPGYKWDAPQDILDGALNEQRRLLSGYKGHPTTPEEKWVESQMPKHVAISLNGEPTFYPHLGEFIRLCHRRGMTTFLVTNGSRPDLLAKLDPLPTQLYVSIDAPNEDVFNKLCVPIGGGAWDKLEETIDLLPSLAGKTRVVARHTLVKGWNMEAEKGHVEQYAKLDNRAQAHFIESKGYVYVGYSRERMTIDNMPSYDDVQRFTSRLAPLVGYEQQGGRHESRVTLLVKPGVERMLDLEAWERDNKVEDHPPVSLKDGTLIKDSNWELVNRRLAALRAGAASEGTCGCGHPHEAHAVPTPPPGMGAGKTPNVTLGGAKKGAGHAHGAGGNGCCGGH